MSDWVYVAFVSSFVSAQASPPQEKPAARIVRFDRLILRNGNTLTGTIVGTRGDEIIIQVKIGLLGIHKELVEKRFQVDQLVQIEPTQAAPTFVKPARRTVLARPSVPPKLPSEVPMPSVDIPDPDPVLRQRITRLLLQLHKGDPTAQTAAMDEISKSGGNGQIYVVASLPTMESIAPVLLGALERMQENDGFPFLVKMIPRLNDSVKPAAFGALATKKIKEAIPTIVSYLESKNRGVCAAAISALATFQATDYFGNILNLISSPNEKISAMATTAVESLARIPEFEEQAREDILDAFHRTTDDNSRIQITGIIGRLQIPDVSALVDLLREGNPRLRSAAAVALGELKDREAVTPLCNALLLDSDRQTKMALMAALAKIKDYEAMPALISQLDDDNADVRANAVSYLSQITGVNLGFDRQAWQDSYNATKGKPDTSRRGSQN